MDGIIERGLGSVFSMFLVDPVSRVPEPEWDAAVRASEEAWMPHTSAYGKALETWPGRTRVGFAVRHANTRQILALVPAWLVEERRLKIWKRRRLEAFCGVARTPVLEASKRTAVLDFIRAVMARQAHESGAYVVAWALHPLAPAFRNGTTGQTEQADHLMDQREEAHTWLLDLKRTETELWDGMEGRARTEVRKAEKKGVTVREAEKHEGQMYYRLHSETYRRTGVSPHPLAYFERIWSDFFEKGLCRVFMAERDGRTIAAVNISLYKDAAEYWTGASSQEALKTGANSLLQWTAIRWMRSEGLAFYNCGEAFPHATTGKHKGLNDFKRSFGGYLSPLFKGMLRPSLGKTE